MDTQISLVIAAWNTFATYLTGNNATYSPLSDTNNKTMQEILTLARACAGSLCGIKNKAQSTEFVVDNEFKVVSSAS